jgi:hypothetical protein
MIPAMGTKEINIMCERQTMSDSDGWFYLGVVVLAVLVSVPLQRRNRSARP